jgi:hypothetical protein
MIAHGDVAHDFNAKIYVIYTNFFYITSNNACTTRVCYILIYMVTQEQCGDGRCLRCLLW